MKIALGIPTNRLIKPKTAQSLLDLVNFSKYDWKVLVSSRGYNTSENRNWIATQAVNSGCDYLFFVDDDMILPPHTLEELLLCNKDRDLPQPWFKYEWNDNGSVKRSHDWIFCEDAINNGIDVWANNTLEIKHIGQREY
jgi:hypothetical protein